jgi:hypothetical protein
MHFIVASSSLPCTTDEAVKHANRSGWMSLSFVTLLSRTGIRARERREKKEKRMRGVLRQKKKSKM